MPLYTGDDTVRPMQGITSLGAGLGEALGATAGEAAANWPLAQISGAVQLDAAKRSPEELQMLYPDANPGGIDIPKPEQVPMAAAKAKVKDAGLEGALHLPAGDSIPALALDIMLDRARARRERETTIARGPGGFMAGALSVGTSFLVGAADPLNLAAGFIPVVGEARYARLLASAGESALARAGIRGGVGAAQGAVGTAPLIGLEAYAHTQEGQDYGMADALRSLIMNAGLGGALHAGGGAIADVYRSSKGIPLYPFSPARFDAQGRVIPAEPFAPAPPSPIATAVADLPPRAKEDVLHASLANIIEGKPVQASEILTAAAQNDPRIAESLQIPRDHARILDDVRQRLMATGMPEDEAAANAAIWADRYATRAQRLGQPAWGLYQGEGVDVRGPDGAAIEGGQAFGQRGARPPGPDLFAAREAEGQMQIPGAERIGDGELAQRRADEALKPKVAQKPMDEGLFGDEGKQKSFFQSAPTSPPFYSAVERAVSNIKQERASPEQWLATLKNQAGVKGEELQWLGLEDWLKEQKGPVTRQQVADYVRANQIEVMEVEKGGPQNFDAMPPERQDGLIDAWSAEHGGQAPRHMGVVRDWYNSLEPTSKTKFNQYTLPGGENYREMLLTLPETETPAMRDQRRYAELINRDWRNNPYTPEEDAEFNAIGERTRARRSRNEDETGRDVNYRSSHWDEPNVLAHVRFDDRMVDGKKTLHLAEIQSDWHQQGRRHGYGDPAEEGRLKDTLAAATQHQIAARDEFNATTHGTPAGEEAFARYEEALEAENRAVEALQRFAPTSRVPDAPFKATWPELSLKRMIRYAAEHGYDRVTWDTGETNAERYDLSKHIREVSFHTDQGSPNAGTLLAYGHEGRTVLNREITDAQRELPDIVGKDVAEKLLSQDPAEQRGTSRLRQALTGLELKVGGEGMLGFYDDILPKAAAKLTKKFGGKMGHSEVEFVKLEDRRVGEGDFPYEVLRPDGTVWNRMRTRASADAEIADHPGYTLRVNEDLLGARVRTAPVHSLDVTPSMRDAAMSEGFPLFQRGAGDELRGRITLQDQKAIIDLFAKADRSTFMHESSHLWLDEMMRDTAGADVPAGLKADRDIILKWLGVDRAEDIGTSQHEQWARGFEQYLMEGNAPSSALAGVFAKLKAWLTAIYQHLTSLGQPISDDIRGVFDRMLATDEQIAQRELGARQEPGGRPIAATPPSQAARTGNPAIDAILENPITQRNIDHPAVDRDHTIPYTAGGSVPLENPAMFIDKRFPRSFTIDGVSFDPAQPFSVHENVEQHVMETLIKAGMDKLLAYKIAHWGWAEPAEGAWYRAHGIDQAKAEAAYAPYMAAIQHGPADDVPAALYRDPYPHDEPSAARHEALAEPRPTAEEIAQATKILQDAGLVPADIGDAAGAQVVPGPRSARGPRARDPQTYSLFEFLADRGGIRPDPDLAVIFGGKNPFVPGFGRLLRKTGMPLDRAREAAVEAGYLFDPASGEPRPTESTVTHLRDALDAENRGQKQYRAGEEKTQGIDRDEEQHRIEGDLDAALTEVGLDPTAVTGTTRDRVIQIMRKEHVADPLEAYERAVMEEDRRGVETAGTEPVAHTIPGWDVPDERAAAPGPSRPVAVQPGSGDAGAGAAARQPGPGDRGPPGRPAADPAAQRAAWRDIARAPDPANEPAAIEAWQAAEKLPEPPSADPGKRLAAIQKDAAAAEAIWAEVSPYLADEVRQRFDDIIRGLDVESADRAEMIRQGAACLAVATGVSA